MRGANQWKAVNVKGPNGITWGYKVDLPNISVAAENIFYNYDDSDPALIRFYLSNKNILSLYFSELGSCVLIPDADGRPVFTPTQFKKLFNCKIGFVPILGPVEHHELLYDKEAARRALFNYQAARNFRNIWHHYPERFEEFKSLLQQTWPGMDIEPPEVDRTHIKPRLHMYCPEQRRSRELFWSGFGFQVWCQMLTHLIQSKDCSIFLIDEPDIYLHSELQRHLLNLLRSLGPDILIATHSTDMIIESEIEDILVISKARVSARRLTSVTQLGQVFDVLGSNANPILTQLAKTRRVIFVEGNDFKVLSKFARKLSADALGSRRDFSVVPVGGFSPERIKTLKIGMEEMLGSKILAAAILDRDYRCDEECDAIAKDCSFFCDVVQIFRRKELENFLLVATAIDRAASRRLAEKERSSGKAAGFKPTARSLLDDFAGSRKAYVLAQVAAEKSRFLRASGSTQHLATISEAVYSKFEIDWLDATGRLNLIPGKDAMSAINAGLQASYGISLTPSAIIDAMSVHEVPDEMKQIVTLLSAFIETPHKGE